MSLNHRFHYVMFRIGFDRKIENLQMWIAWHLPKWLVKWCAVRLMAHATTGEYGDTVVPELTCIDALKRWE